jgi:transcriptional regulator with XRE-family HTH domain
LLRTIKTYGMEVNSLAKKLKGFRALRGMSQEYLAEESRVSLRTVQRIENNESKPTGETIKRISTALGIEINELVGANVINETINLNATIFFLKKQRSKTNEKSEIKTFEKFIKILNNLKEKDLSSEQMEGIESYITYLELEKIPSFSNEMFHRKLAQFKKHLKTKLKLVPENYYTTMSVSFAISFAIAFAIQSNIEPNIKIGVTIASLTLMLLGILMDSRIKRQERSFNF